MGDKMLNHPSMILRELCYPSRQTPSSCIRLPTEFRYNFDFNPELISLLPRFSGTEDTYIFLREFEEVCTLMISDPVSENFIRLRLISFALKDDAKRWFYSLTANSIGSWEEFVKVFLNKYFPHYRTVGFRHEQCYSSGQISSSCIRLPTESRYNFNFDPKLICLLPRFTGIEDAYIFLREFEEISMLMISGSVSENFIRLRLIPFALKDDAKRWFYNLTANSISSWEEFVREFLNKYFSHDKTIEVRREINTFCQLDHEPFWRYFERFKELLAICPHHGFEKWQLCQIVYEGLDFHSKAFLESMCRGDFLDFDEHGAWSFFEDLADKTTHHSG